MLKALKREFIKVKVDVHDLDFVIRTVQILLLKHLLRLDQTAETEGKIMFGHTNSFEQLFAEEMYDVALEDLGKGMSILDLWLEHCLREVHIIEFTQISEQVLINDFITDDCTSIQVIKFEFGSILI